MIQERKHFIDNLRWMAILLLFSFHAAQIWSGGEYSGFYVWSYTDNILYIFSTAVYPWYMTLLFVLAGMSSKYALQKRTDRQFIIERTKKLIIPFIFGVLVLVPVMTYIAEIYFNGYSGSYFDQYRLFFSKATDLTGYRGGFTPAHLWFLLYLFIISLVSLLMIRIQQKALPDLRAKRLPYWALILLFIPVWLMFHVLNIGGKSIGQFLILYIFGYYILSKDRIQQEIKRYRFVSLILSLVSGIIYTYLYCFINLRNELITGLFVFFGWLGILTLLGFGQTLLNFQNKISAYFTRASYPIYIIHLPVLVIAGFFVLKFPVGIFFQFLLIILLSFTVTILLYEGIRRLPYFRVLFGIDK
ncbi:acyltransferase family protein [Christensenella intestinihominis]|uniref:acyltransferase family protein n=1 Tax=Christensenella intestinihominis TaxID=1851429 RepID=UPI000832A525|nr:acyltransferase family protein [Christensenella intestinihominis]